MKTALFAAAMVLGLGGAAHAWTAGLAQTAPAAEFEAVETAPFDTYPAYEQPHCVGLASGTAPAYCGTATGGPSGGLH